MQERVRSNHIVPNVAVSLLHEFDDVFLKDILCILPSLKGIEHQIDLIPGVVIPNLPAYIINLKKTKELQMQVDELIMKGYIYERIRPCVMLVLLMPKKDGT